MKSLSLPWLFLLTVALSACATSVHNNNAPVRDPKYPAKWWAPIPKEEAKWWEILPQAAGPGEVILSKRTELGVFSNFAATPIKFRGKIYASIEGFWQMMKYPEGPSDPRAKFPGLVWKFTREEVAQMVAFEAKDAGKLAEENMKKMGIDWITFEGKRLEYRGKDDHTHYDLIEGITREKLTQHPHIKALLKRTGDLILRPDHHTESGATDSFRYYDIYMKLRLDI